MVSLRFWVFQSCDFSSSNSQVFRTGPCPLTTPYPLGKVGTPSVPTRCPCHHLPGILVSKLKEGSPHAGSFNSVLFYPFLVFHDDSIISPGTGCQWSLLWCHPGSLFSGNFLEILTVLALGWSFKLELQVGSFSALWYRRWGRGQGECWWTAWCWKTGKNRAQQEEGWLSWGPWQMLQQVLNSMLCLSAPLHPRQASIITLTLGMKGISLKLLTD